MMSVLRRVVVVVLLIAAGGPAAAQEDGLSAARGLYDLAAYEDALVLLDGLTATADRPDERRMIQQYRAFCLLALGRAEDAEAAIEAIFAIDPTFVPAADDLSPRLLTAFSDVRQRALPAMIRRNYLKAKTAYDGANYLEAAALFGEVLGVLDHLDPEVMSSEPFLAEVRTLATGFRDLSLAAAPPPPALTPPEPEPAVAVVPLSPPERVIYGPEHTAVVPPIAELQELPRFEGPYPGSGRGVLEVVIDETGAVMLAVMTSAINPIYDRLAAEAARKWRFRPAALNGVPVKYRKTILIDIRP